MEIAINHGSIIIQELQSSHVVHVCSFTQFHRFTDL